MDSIESYTLEQSIDSLGFGKFQWRLATILGFCTMADAIEMMLLAILGPALACYWPEVTQMQIASVTTVVFAGMMFGAFTFGILADKFGRKKIVAISAILNTIFGALTSLAPSFYWLLIARTFVGLALAGAAQGSTLMLEYLPSNKRATISIAIQIFWSFGSIFEYFLAMLIVPTLGWRFLTLLSAIPVGIIAIFIFFVPESPRFFVAKGQPEKAEQILENIARINRSSMPAGKLIDIHAEEECGSIKQLFHKNYKRTTFLLAFMWITAAMSYYGLVLINTSLMTFAEKNISENQTKNNSSNNCKMLTTDDYKSLMLTTVGEMVGIPYLIFLLSKLGRRKISFINYFLSSICFFSLLFVKFDQTRLINFITFFARMFISAEFSLIYLYTMEVYPTVIRAMAVGSASSMARIGAMITPFLAQVLIKKTYVGTILIYTFATGLAAIFGILLPIETKGRDLKQTTSDQRPVINLSDDFSPSSAWPSTINQLKSFAHLSHNEHHDDRQPLMQTENQLDEENFN